MPSNDVDSGTDRLFQIFIRRTRPAMQSKGHKGRGSDLSNSLDRKMLSLLAGNHAFAHAVRITYCGGKHVHFRLRDELASLFGSGQCVVRTGTVRVNLRAASDVPNFSLDDHGRVYGLELLDSLACRAGIPSSGSADKSNTTESKPAFTASRALAGECVWSAFKKMGKSNSSRRLRTPGRERRVPANSRFSLRGAHHNRHVQFTRSLEDAFQQDEISDVEVPDGGTASSCFVNYFNKFLHSCFTSDVLPAPRCREWRKMQRVSLW